jgi:hypothetical protein
VAYFPLRSLVDNRRHGLHDRGVHFAGMTAGPDDAWIRQVGRNLTDPIDGFLREKRFCLMDRDAKFTTAFRTLSTEAEIERFMRSITSECPDRMIFLARTRCDAP